MAFQLNKKSLGHAGSSSMSDIAFLLLIFFLATTIFTHDRGIAMLLPTHAPDRIGTRTNLVTIQAQANGSITLNGERVAIDQIRTDVRQMLLQNNKRLIVLETHKDTGYGLMIDILDELRIAGAKHITLRKIGE
jgi:biopolymer transport protein ExbD